MTNKIIDLKDFVERKYYPPDFLQKMVEDAGAKVVPKKSSRLMRIISKLLRLVGNKSFMDRFWTTIGKTIYYPEKIDNPYNHPTSIIHELVHVYQYKKYGLWFMVSYLLLPVPFFFAYWRFRWEREAYMAQIYFAYNPEQEVDRIVESLWKNYAWTYPKSWMREWFMKEVEKIFGEKN